MRRIINVSASNRNDDPAGVRWNNNDLIVVESCACFTARLRSEKSVLKISCRTIGRLFFVLARTQVSNSAFILVSGRILVLL